MKKQLIYNLVAATVAILFAWIFYYESLDLPRVAYLFPRRLTYLITILAVALVIEAYYKYRKGVQEEQEEGIKVLRATLFTGSIVLYILAIDLVGYFITTPLFIFGTMYFLKSTKTRNIFFITVGFTLFIYLLFVRFLNLPIPLGSFS